MNQGIENLQEGEGRDYRILILLFVGMMICSASLISYLNADKTPFSFINQQEFVTEILSSSETNAMRPFFFLPVRINNADRQLLQTVPGIGPVLANEIILLRDSRKEFQNFEELLDIEGIGPKKLAAIRKYCVMM